ncbi:MAG: helix-turn-helix transcriptional regulator [Ruminococcaceae bacterium]|nr:helix-turn-helix transcriptional regulator [Oscillospiraceae bacterium]
MVFEYGIGTTMPNWFVKEDKAPGYTRIYYVYSGSAIYSDGESTVALQEGKLYVFPTTFPYSIDYDSKAPLRCLFVHIRPPSSCVPNLFCFDISENKVLKHCVELFELSIANENQDMLNCTAELFCIYGRQNHIIETVGASFAKVLEYIDNNLENDIRVEYLAKLAGYNRQYFIRLFNQHMGVTPHQYIMNQRFKTAVKLILSNTSITAVSLACGYKDLKTFSRAFKERYGLSPNEWKKQYQPTP